MSLLNTARSRSGMPDPPPTAEGGMTITQKKFILECKVRIDLLKEVYGEDWKFRDWVNAAETMEELVKIIDELKP